MFPRLSDVCLHLRKWARIFRGDVRQENQQQFFCDPPLPTSRASARLVKDGRTKTWYGVSHAAGLQNVPDNADKLTNEGGEAPQGRTEAEGASETLSGCQECQSSAGGTSHAIQVAHLSWIEVI